VSLSAPLNVNLSIKITVDNLPELMKAVALLVKGACDASPPTEGLVVPTVESMAQPMSPVRSKSKAVPKNPDAFRRTVTENAQKLENGQFSKTGWGTVSNLDKLFKQLPLSYQSVVSRAIGNGGQASRAEVYEVIGRPADKSLNGFTKPVNRLMKKLVAAGELPKSAEVLLKPIYDKSVKAFQSTQGFTVPLEIVEIFRRQKTGNDH
jgi:hypothetical protein